MVYKDIAAIILAAGESRRMGQSKLTLPWGETTVLGQVVATFAAAGIEEILVVTGGARQPVEAAVAELAREFPVRAVYNPDYARGEMLSSLQRGLVDLSLPPLYSPISDLRNGGMKGGRRATLIALGDQPQVQVSLVQRICAAFTKTGKHLIVPSFQMRRGHPWLAARPLWPEILALPANQTPSDFINAHSEDILYLPVETDSILLDVDTPEDHERLKPRA
ncbi:MAG: nucleotidyltransferase family protein [Chloroflexi bacterium]|nr:nucleotidyltransferase family protein [Chloroflexota bacterium]